VLLLDEPTNDLDTDTLAAVEDLLDGWPGTLIVVSHDRYLLERVCDRQWALLGDGTLRDLPGGVEQYLELRRAAAAGPAGSGLPRGGEVPSSGTGAAGPTASPADQRAAKKAVQRRERRLSKLVEEEEEHEDKVAADPTDCGGGARLEARRRERVAARGEVAEER